MKEFMVHTLWHENRKSDSAKALNEFELNRLSREGWEIVGFFDEDNLCVLLQRERENENGLEK